MTIQEAINVMQKYTDTKSGISKVVEEAHRMAIKALEKQIPMKYIHTGISFKCPYCGNISIAGDVYCQKCGQKIDWSTSEDA